MAPEASLTGVNCVSGDIPEPVFDLTLAPVIVYPSCSFTLIILLPTLGIDIGSSVYSVFWGTELSTPLTVTSVALFTRTA